MACQTLSQNDPVTIDLGPNLSFKRLAEPDRLLAAANWPEQQHVPKGTHHSMASRRTHPCPTSGLGSSDFTRCLCRQCLELINNEPVGMSERWEVRNQTWLLAHLLQ